MAFFKKMAKKINEWNYYLEEDGGSASVISWFVDTMMLSMAVLVVSYLWLVYKTKTPLLSILLALLTASAAGFVHFKLRIKQLDKKRQAKIAKVTTAYRKKSLSKLTFEQFKRHLAKTLYRSGIFEDIKVGKKFFKAIYQGKEVLIGFYHTPYNEQVPPFELYKFFKVLKHCGYKIGYYFSTSPFNDMCRTMAQDNNDIKLHLIDAEELLKMMEESGMLQDVETIDKYVQHEIEKSKLKRKQNRKNLLTAAKAKTYIIYGLLFLGASLIFRTYFIYYFILFLSFTLMGLLVYIAMPKHRGNKAHNQLPIDKSAN